MSYQLADLVRLMACLRDPDHGCPWDRSQDYQSIVPFTLEEAHEVIGLPVARGIAVRHTQRATEAGFAKKGRVGHLKLDGSLIVCRSKPVLGSSEVHDQATSLNFL